jgi:hypothetical protein
MATPVSCAPCFIHSGVESWVEVLTVAGDSEREDVSGMVIFECVEDQHKCDGQQPEKREICPSLLSD